MAMKKSEFLAALDRAMEAFHSYERDPVRRREHTPSGPWMKVLIDILLVQQIWGSEPTNIKIFDHPVAYYVERYAGETQFSECRFGALEAAWEFVDDQQKSHRVTSEAATPVTYGHGPDVLEG